MVPQYQPSFVSIPIYNPFSYYPNQQFSHNQGISSIIFVMMSSELLKFLVPNNYVTGVAFQSAALPMNMKSTNGISKVYKVYKNMKFFLIKLNYF